MRVLLFALAFLCCAGPAAADRYLLTYSGLALNLVPLGEINVDITITRRGYEANAHLRSSGLMNLFERTDLRAVSRGAIDESGVQWRRYSLDHRYSHKHRTIEMRPTAESVRARIEPTYRLWGDPPASDDEKRASRDPLSTLVAMAVDVSRTQRCSGAYPTFDGRFHYIMSLGDGGVERYRGGGFEGDVLECELIYSAISGFEQTDNGRRRITQGRIWFALGDPAFAPPVRISTPLSAGGAVIRLTDWRRVEVTVGEDVSAPEDVEEAAEPAETPQ
ncbi:MAG: DUF3108 domain-containing protein [Hyphomonadaceae bacterium]|nr:DUF3108 domain-containing protein [Hyphomonadaceae bacterium]